MSVSLCEYFRPLVLQPVYCTRRLHNGGYYCPHCGDVLHQYDDGIMLIHDEKKKKKIKRGVANAMKCTWCREANYVQYVVEESAPRTIPAAQQCECCAEVGPLMAHLPFDDGQRPFACDRCYRRFRTLYLACVL